MPLLDEQWLLLLGILCDVLSLLVYLAPVPTFYRIFRGRSTEEFHSTPYLLALYGAMLTLYYGIVKDMNLTIIAINSVGCMFEIIYLIIYIVYATRGQRIFTATFLILVNGVSFGLIFLFTHLFSHDSKKVVVVGGICAVVRVCAFASPLSIMGQVIRTRSVQFMPLSLSLTLTIAAAFWVLYGFSLGDYFIAAPNIVGLALGFAQIFLYFFYGVKRNDVLPKPPPEEPQDLSKESV